MKITFVLPYAGLQGGIRVIGIYADRLKKRGHDVELVSVPQVFTMSHIAKWLLLGRGFPKPEPSHLDTINVAHRVLDGVRPVTNADIPDGDIVIATYYTTACGVLNLSASKGTKVIFIQNYETPPGIHNETLDASWRMPMHKIVISKWLVDWAKNRFGDDNVSHVPNSVDVKQFHAPPRDKNARPTVGILYSSSPLKGCNVSIKAIKRVLSTLPSLRVVSFGAEIPDFRMPLPGCSEFHYRPQQQRLRELYAQCDVWLCGSNVEGFHLPPLEAMACRCPVVSTRCGGPLDIIQDGINGHLVDVKDDAALAARLLHILELPSAGWRTMSEAAYRTATRYSWDDAADLFEQALYRAVGLQGRQVRKSSVIAAAMP